MMLAATQVVFTVPPPPWLLIVLFVLCMGLLAAGAAYGISERLAMARLQPPVFGAGYLVLASSETLPADRRDVPCGEVVRTAHGRFTFVSDDLTIFTRRFGWTGLVHTPFPLKGTIRWTGPVGFIEGRLPIGPVVFWAAWLGAWTVLWAFLTSSEGTRGWAGLVLGWAFAALIIVVSIWIEKRTLRTVIREIGQSLAILP